MNGQTCHEILQPGTRKPLILKGCVISGKRHTYSSEIRSPFSRHSGGKSKSRQDRFSRAVLFAYSQDLPLTIGLTVSWDALILAGEHDEGHCLWRKPQKRDAYLRKELGRMCRLGQRPFAALWGRDVGRDMGAHVHLSIFWPSQDLKHIVALLSRVTGSEASFVNTPYTKTPVARSVCGGWQIDLNTRDKEGALDWAAYIADQHEKHPYTPDLKGRAFGISQAINTAAQRRAGFIV